MQKEKISVRWRIKKILFCLVLSILCTACSSVHPDTTRFPEESVDRGGTIGNPFCEAPFASPIMFRVDQDHPSKKVTWFSTGAVPDEPAYQICFRNTDELLFCTDVKPGQTSGIVYCISDVPVEQAVAEFCPR